MWRPYKVGNLTIDPCLVLSPMSGVTTCAFRRLIKELNPGSVGLLISEFISVEAMTRKVQRSLAMMRFLPEERPYCIQIFGYDIDRMRDAAMMCQDAGVDLVDINCGCPAPKVVKRGGGAELMRQPEHLQQIIREVRKVLSIPLTIKIRAGWDDSSKNAVAIAQMAEGEGVNGIAVHGRTRAQLYRGEADWDLVAKVKSSISLPVLGSGDVVDLDSARERYQKGVDGLFIGRAALFNPFIFSELISGEKRPLKSDPLLAVSVLERYVALLKEEFSPTACIGKVKQLASQMCRGHPWRKELLTAPSLQAQEAILLKVREHGGLYVSPQKDDSPTRPASDEAEAVIEDCCAFESDVL